MVPGAVYQSVIVGGGYGTGREVVEFISRNGPWNGLYANIFIGLLMGLVMAVSFDFARTFMAQVKPSTLAEHDAVDAELAEEGRATLIEAGVPADQITFTRRADMRHQGQGHEIVVTLPDSDLADVDLDQELRPLFYSRYEEIYGYAHRHLGLEIATCRLTASGPRPRIALAESDHADTDAAVACKGTRPAYFAELGGFVDTPVYDRYLLQGGMVFNGPAIVEEKDSTAVIGPGARVRVDRFANLVAEL